MYGKNGTKYNLDGTEFQVDEKFIVATLMAIIVSIREVNQENYPSIDAAIERMAESIYEQIKEVKSDDIERTTDAPTQ
jgi:hypothetical protein